MTQADRAVQIAREMLGGGAEVVEVRVGRVHIKVCRPMPPAPVYEQSPAEPEREEPEPADPRERAQAQRRREMGWTP